MRGLVRKIVERAGYAALRHRADPPRTLDPGRALLEKPFTPTQLLEAVGGLVVSSPER